MNASLITHFKTKFNTLDWHINLSWSTFALNAYTDRFTAFWVMYRLPFFKTPPEAQFFDRLVLRTHCFYVLLYLETSLLGVNCNILHIRITCVVLKMWKIPFWLSVHKYLRKYSKPYSWMAASAGNSWRAANSHLSSFDTLPLAARLDRLSSPFGLTTSVHQWQLVSYNTYSSIKNAGIIPH